MNLKALSRREKILVGLTCLSVLGAICKFLLLDPLKRQTSARSRLALIQSELASNTVKLVSQPTTRGPASLSIDPQLAEKLKVENDGFTSMVRGLVEDVQTGGFELQRLEAKAIEKGDGFDAVEYGIDVLAPFPALGQFIERLENSSLLVEVRNLEITRDGSDLRRVVAKIRATSYVLHKEEGQ